ncbi:DUF3307 domain-containing protein [Geochorda subterranea]|uniref:DUF3307 domain-containing protein n=1 Tax=Geochorda subterranea TaxID=3109564 RepID=A0ABZ1BTL8_9FIRM|nr:DUF3307 domain-containing protein [Limnochorda sp. LNt]WRP15523.1 DUF3307 domain-containing protein [Limnochorda sp. LNt]
MTPLAVRLGVLDPETVRSSLFWLAVAAHLLADFAVRKEGMPGGGRDEDQRDLPAHGAVHLGLMVLLGLPAASPALVAAWTAVAAAHVAIDAALGTARRPGVGAFLLDQALHVWVISAAVRLLPPAALRPWPPAGVLLGVLAGSSPVNYLGAPEGWRLLAVYLAVVLGGAPLVRLVLQAWQLRPASRAAAPEGGVSEAPGTGMLVGMLERALILTFLLFEATAAVGFVLAAKSIARFKELEDRAFAEYYLVGTLASVVVAVAGFLVLRRGP